MLEDFQNWSLEKCREVMLEYRETRDPKTFNILLARFDKYILYLINNYRRQTKFLAGEDPQELYHIGILGFYRCLLSGNTTTSAKYLLLRISSYVVTELRRRHIHKVREKLNSNSIEDIQEENQVDFQERAVENHESYLNTLSADLLLEALCLTKHESRLLRLKYYEGKTFRQVAREVGLAYSTVYIHITKALAKLKKYANKGELR